MLKLTLGRNAALKSEAAKRFAGSEEFDGGDLDRSRLHRVGGPPAISTEYNRVGGPLDCPNLHLADKRDRGQRIQLLPRAASTRGGEV